MADLTPLDPDLEQVIEDLSKDPRASLFLTEPRKLLCGLRDGSLTVPSGRTGLAPSERKLLEVHRHELAWALRQAFRAEFFSHADAIHTRPRASLSRRELASRVGKRLKHLPESVRKTRQGSVLKGYLRPQGEPGLPTRVELIGAALTLEDTPIHRLYLAASLCTGGQLRSAVRLAREIASGPGDARVRASALGWSGVALWSMNKPADALQVYTQARQIAERNGLDPEIVLEYRFNILGLSLDLHDKAGILKAAQAIAGTGATNKLYLEAANRMRAEGTSRELTLASSCRETVRQVESRLDIDAREFLYALL